MSGARALVAVVIRSSVHHAHNSYPLLCVRAPSLPSDGAVKSDRSSSVRVSNAGGRDDRRWHLRQTSSIKQEGAAGQKIPGKDSGSYLILIHIQYRPSAFLYYRDGMRFAGCPMLLALPPLPLCGPFAF